MNRKLQFLLDKSQLVVLLLFTQINVAQSSISDTKLLELVDNHIQTPIKQIINAEGDVFLQRDMTSFLSSELSPRKYNSKKELVPTSFDEVGHNHDDEMLREFLNRAQPSVQTTEKYFNQAANEFNVPVAILKAVGQVQSNWVQTAMSEYGSYGLMGLIENYKTQQIALASQITGISSESIINDAKSNIRAAAALLAYYQRQQPKSEKLEDWFEATRELTGLTNEEMKTSLATRFFNVIKNGSKTVSNWKEIITIEAVDVSIPQIGIANKSSSNSKTAGIQAVDYPNALPRFTACNYGVGRNGYGVDYYFVHYMATGTYEGAISWFSDCSRTSPSSANYCIRNSDGQISQVVSEADRAYAQGVTGQAQWNGAGVSTEHEVLATNLAMWDSEPMLVAASNLAIDVCNRNNISRTRRVNNGERAIYGHNDVNLSTDCPNLTQARWNGLIARISGGIVLPTVALPTLYAISSSGNNDVVNATWKPNTEATLLGYRLYYATDDTLLSWALAADETTLTATTTSISLSQANFKVVPSTDVYHFRLSAVVPNSPYPNVESLASDVYSRSANVTGKKVLIVDGFDRTSGKYTKTYHSFAANYFNELKNNASLQISSVANEIVEDGTVSLSNYDIVVWFTGDDSSANVTFSTNEKAKLKTYLENGGKLLISGSEIAYNLGRSAAAAYDLAFMNGYLKSSYISDGLTADSPATGIAGRAFEGVTCTLGAVYPETYPDNIAAFGGSTEVFSYATSGKYGGIVYKGLFGTGTIPSSLIYVTFGIENISQAQRDAFMKKALVYFDAASLGVEKATIVDINDIVVYPNPFDSQIKLTLNTKQVGKVAVQLMDLQGRVILGTNVLIGASFENEIQIETEKLIKGVYICEVRFPDGKIKVAKVIKK